MEHTSQFKMGSLFDGSGGFPLASVLCDIEPVWASEIEPFPIRVTRARFPNMHHYGDISKIDVSTLEPVDLISGGSPCQDMSVAGKRHGMSKQCPKCDFKVVGNAEIKECPECGAELEYTRSGLFMDQIRIVKEMRKKDELEQLRSGRTDEHIRPRFMLWENVTGAFSSNKGEDFRAVLEETAKIKDPTATIPRPPKGKWQNAGCIVGDGYSIAWRVFDAQYWGVPQRRRRIALVADFGGQSAGEILFKRNGLSRNFTESRKAWQGITGNLAESIGETGNGIGINGDIAGTEREVVAVPSCIAFEPGAASRVGNHTYDNQCGALRANMGDNQFAVALKYFFENHSQDTRYKGPLEISPTVSATYGMGGNNQPFVVHERKETIRCYDIGDRRSVANESINIAPTITARMGTGGNNVPVILPENNHQIIPIQDQAISNGSGNGLGIGKENDPMYTLMADTQHGIAYSLQGNMIGREDHNGPQGSGVNEEVAFTLNATDRHAVAYGIDRAAFNQGENALYDFSILDEQTPTLIARGPNGVCHAQYTYWDGGQIAGTLTKCNANGAQRMPDKDNFNAVIEKRTYQDVTGSLMASGYNKLGTQEAMNDMFVATEYIVRRLTPLECSRLQGFPDWWVDGLQNENPTEEELAFWREVFETHREIVTGASKPKTDKQIRKWLKEEPNDGAMYKMWGNGIALPCFLYVIEGIKEVLERTSNSNSSTTATEVN